MSRAAELFDVRDARVVVTGAASGLGLAMAEVMADGGARVTLADVDSARLDEVGGELERRGADVRLARLDVSDPDQVRRVFDDVVEAQGGVDVAFANAGISLEPGVLDARGGLANLDRDTWGTVLGVNLDGVLHTLREAAGHMKRQGSGRIVVTASTAGFGTDPLVGYSYSATKAAVIVIVRQAALELARHGVHVNAIAPGPFRTRIGGGAAPIPPEAWEEIVALGQDGGPGRAQGRRAAAGVAGVELHDRRRRARRRRPAADVARGLRMRAVITRAQGVMEIADVEPPGEPGAGEVVVRPQAVGICGSDFHFLLGELGRRRLRVPADPGPRGGAAVVESVGPDCRSGLGAGDRVGAASAQPLRSLLPLPDRARQRLRQLQPDRDPRRRRPPAAADHARGAGVRHQRAAARRRRAGRAAVDRGADRQSRTARAPASTSWSSVPGRSGRPSASWHRSAGPRSS